MVARDRIGPLLLSLGAHATVIAVLVARPLFQTPEPLEPLRLVFVEPPPPPPPPAGIPGGTTGATAPVRPTTPKPVVVPRRPTPKPVVRPKAPVRQTAKQPTTPKPAEPATAPAGSTTGEASGVTGGKVGGEAGGKIGGVIGGTGTGIPHASEVAVPPVVLRRVTPRYPRQARASGANGLVLLEAVLDREGHVEKNIRVVRSVPMLDEAAVEALRQWRFRPARDHRQQTVRVVLEVPMRFVLE